MGLIWFFKGDCPTRDGLYYLVLRVVVARSGCSEQGSGCNPDKKKTARAWVGAGGELCGA